jgi:hypothetical protein
MMHCTMDDLLALQHGDGSVWAREHLEGCEGCRKELDALYQRVAGLKALPALRPPRDRWGAVRAVIVAERTHRRRRWMGVGLAAAAGLLGFLVIRPVVSDKVYAEDLAQAKQQSAQLESALRAYDGDDRVVSGRSAALCAQLEERIALLDGQLTQSAVAARDREILNLWRQRVDLMQKLVAVRVTRAAYVGL